MDERPAKRRSIVWDGADGLNGSTVSIPRRSSRSDQVPALLPTYDPLAPSPLSPSTASSSSPFDGRGDSGDGLTGGPSKGSPPDGDIALTSPRLRDGMNSLIMQVSSKAQANPAWPDRARRDSAVISPSALSKQPVPAPAPAPASTASDSAGKKPARSAGSSEESPSKADGKAAPAADGALGGGKPPLPRGSACLICRKRKLRCDGARPKCATCARLGHDCGYGGQEGSVERLSEYAGILEEKIRILETELTKWRTIEDGGSLLSSTYPPNGEPRQALRDEINNSFSAMLQAPEAPLSVGSDQAPDGLGEPTGLMPTWGADLPPAEIVDELMGLFFTTHGIVFPMIQRARFMVSLHHGGIRTKPSLALVYAMLAIAAPYHTEASVRETSNGYYQLARTHFEAASSSIAGALGLGDWAAVGSTGPERVAAVTVELVQACVVLACVEIGWNDHQRAFMTVGTAARLAAMLGLLRMDEVRIGQSDGIQRQGVLRPPALHPLPKEALLLEECRRTVWCVYVIDRCESISCGWPAAIQEAEMRLLLPALDHLFENGTVGSNDNAHCWPPGVPDADDVEGKLTGLSRRTQGPAKVSPFAWLCRIACLGSRLSNFHHRPMGFPLGGPLRPLDLLCSKLQLTERDINEIEESIRWIRRSFVIDAGSGPFGPVPQGSDALEEMYPLATSSESSTLAPGRPNLAVIMCELTTWLAVVAMHHLRLVTESAVLTEEQMVTSWRRCFDASRGVYNLAKGMLRSEANMTRVWNIRVNPFSVLPAYMLFCLSFPLRFLIGAWEDLQTAQMQIPALFEAPWVAKEEERVEMIETILEVMSRCSERWPVASRFIELNRKGQAELYERLAVAALSDGAPAGGTGSAAAYETVGSWAADFMSDAA